VTLEAVPAAELSARDAYGLLTDLVAPRPIAWVSTVGAAGHRNLAPFSYFQAVCSRPPIVMLSVAWHPAGRAKDTLRNALETRELTISHVSEDLADAMNRTAIDAGPHESEWDLAAIEPAVSRLVAPPRVAQARAALECRVTHGIPLGRGPSGGPAVTLLLAEVLCFQVPADLARRDAHGRLAAADPARLQALGRLGGSWYAGTAPAFELGRPTRERPES
jgi:flavin reductase (DIM6/NTAB) family NADH-FMN oxidoreductase RutF